MPRATSDTNKLNAIRERLASLTANMMRVSVPQSSVQAVTRPEHREKMVKEDPTGWFNTKWSCHVCGKYFDREDKRRDHMALYHHVRPSETCTEWSYDPWACHVCGRDYPNRPQRHSHHLLQHAKQELKWPAGQPADAHQPTAETAGFWDPVGVKNDAAVAQGHREYFVPRVNPDAPNASVGSS